MDYIGNNSPSIDTLMKLWKEQQQALALVKEELLRLQKTVDELNAFITSIRLEVLNND